jgi:Uma2 family endonuclease
MRTNAVPEPTPHLFTRKEYHRMGRAGLFREERVELLDGEVITMSPQNSPHASTIHRLWSVLSHRLGSAAYVRAQAPVILDDWSEPEPDIAVCQPDPYDYAREHPRTEQVLIVIEVADSSLTYDRTRKARAYAASGIPVYWLVNLRDRHIEVRTNPDRATGQYRSVQVVAEGETVTLPDGQQLAVADILPPI